MAIPFLSGLLGVVCGTTLVNLIGGGTRPNDSVPHHSLVLAGDMVNHAPAVSAAAAVSPQCPEWDMIATVQKQAQHEYCFRRFTGRPPRPDIAKATLHLPGEGMRQDFFVYKSGDIVSGSILSSGAWEPHMARGLVDALARAADAKGLPRERVHLLDIGGNVGSHTAYVQAAGFPVIVFEPMLQNEDIIRSNLCVADPEQERVALFTKGLGAEDGVCTFYSHLTINQGDGNMFCDGTKPQEVGYVDQGKVEVARLDDLLLPCGGGKELPPGIVFGAMKRDVEGFEPHVLKAARGFLTQARVPFIVFEIGRLGKEERRSVLRFFYDMGYQAGTQGFVDGLGQPEDLPGVEDVFLVLPLGEGEGEVGEAKEEAAKAKRLRG
jgi:FkbM family methyltransferase